MTDSTMPGQLAAAVQQRPDEVWLRDRKGDEFSEWSWQQASEELLAAASWLEHRYGNSQANIALLSRNRAHWVLADLAIMGSGNVTIPLFTTLAAPTAEYILGFTDATALLVGEAENWDAVRKVLPAGIDLITLPGVEIDEPCTRWEDMVSECAGYGPAHIATSDELISIVFTSGTTGVPKGVMQNHDSFILPMQRGRAFFTLRDNPRFLSYLPLSHIAERQIVMVQSILFEGTIDFNESLQTLARDMADAKPNYVFGAPRVWEQLQQGVLAKFGSQDALDAALANGGDAIARQVRQNLGLDDCDYMLTAAAPTPPALIEWYDSLGMALMEGYGQTEFMAAICSRLGDRRIGSIGKPLEGVDMKFSDEGELLLRAPGPAVGYYKMPEKTAETFVDGWVHTGDKAYVDDDGFVFLTGRVKDYFKTIQGKFVAPAPIENAFAKNALIEQLCLLGRGYSKTVIVAVVSELAQQQDREFIEQSLVEQASSVNESVDHHARIGAVIVATDPWTIDNEMLTPTLKIRRDEVEGKYGTRAQELAHDAAVGGAILIEWIH